MRKSCANVNQAVGGVRPIVEVTMTDVHTIPLKVSSDQLDEWRFAIDSLRAITSRKRMTL